jgi:hypothetical protein
MFQGQRSSIVVHNIWGKFGAEISQIAQLADSWFIEKQIEEFIE